ncbi:MAG: ParB/RepB/Spo0J family partition protein [Phenylobacterium sp.]|uniref:ParB/RepB/Spo0J family partition protein n=1 Tax=Phenylobacterium sp. TaxID=1871053 RepID=UPI0027181C55|nr:ParB/RepB/Spo0J family partition protein [Phenylobacterium sp.]MDO8900268.1 ParB/RepB/Spo0J family partition protein [Phenylobacterium sp.]MDP2215502.1 ParB/RepB/Spo0J family partition protein [Phenylobacterium sp.]
MAENRRGLGRGLSALLGEAEDENIADAAAAAEAAEAAGPVRALSPMRDLAIDLIDPNAAQPRSVFHDEDMEELTNSIRERGVLQPILVRPLPNGRFEIVAGERRWRASQRVGLHTVPAVVRELDDLQVMEIAIVENVQRADLSAIEEARGYEVLIARFGRTQELVAQVVGKSRSHVANMLRLLTLPGSVQNLVVEGKLSAGHARALITAENPEALAQQVMAKGLSVRDTEALVRKGAAPAARGGASRSGGGAAADKDTDTLALENDLAEVLGLTVQIADRGGAGELKISYKTLEQLDDLCRRLSRTG